MQRISPVNLESEPVALALSWMSRGRAGTILREATARKHLHKYRQIAALPLHDL
jgi:hypothetical protein